MSRRVIRDIGERFWEKVDRSAGPGACWEWQGGRKEAGYGVFYVRSEGRRKIFANTHRFAYALVNGPISEGMVICHQCDNPPCCNPAHLFAGTPADNLRDGIRKGRIDLAAAGRVGGPKAGPMMGRRHAALSDEQALAVLVAFDSGSRVGELARCYRVSDSVISHIVHGQKYCWIPEVAARQKGNLE